MTQRRDDPGLVVDLDERDVHRERIGRVDLEVAAVVGRVADVRRAERPRRLEVRLDVQREDVAQGEHRAGDDRDRDVAVAVARDLRHAAAEDDLLALLGVQHGARHRPELRRDVARGEHGRAAAGDDAAARDVPEAVGAAVAVALHDLHVAERDPELGGDELDDRGVVARPGRGDAREDRRLPRGAHADGRGVEAADERAGDVGALRRQLEAQPDPEAAALGAGPLALGAQLGVAGPAERQVQRALVVAAVELEPRRVQVREGVRLQEVAAPDLGRIDPGGLGDAVHHVLGQERRAVLAVGLRAAPRRLVRRDDVPDDAADLEGVARAGRLRADEPHPPAVARGHRAVIGARVDVEREQAPVGGERRAPALHLLARAGQQGRGALLVPAHGPADEAGEHRDDEVLAVAEHLQAERAADLAAR